MKDEKKVTDPQSRTMTANHFLNEVMDDLEFY